MTHRLGFLVLVACGSPPPPAHPNAEHAPLSLAADDRMLVIPAGRYVAGSTPEERAQAYEDFASSAGNDGARDNKWFDHEQERHIETLPAFAIDLMPVTQAQYAEFVIATQTPAPAIDEAAWIAQGLGQDFATQVTRFVWRDGRPPIGREDHPVVLVTWDEASAYCTWRGVLRGKARRLPSANEFEKAARGDQGMTYPWGNSYEPMKLNSRLAGPNDTIPSGGNVEGASPYGALDMAGNVFQWTATPFVGPGNKMTVKGSAWEDFAGVGRAASLHGRGKTIRHVIVGFRCGADPA